MPLSDREHLEAIIAGNDKRYEQRFTAQENAIAKAELTVDRRLNTMNEMRDDLNEWRGAVMTRPEVEQRFKAVNDKIDLLAGADSRRTGRSSGFESTRVMVFALFAALGTLTSIALGLYAVFGH